MKNDSVRKNEVANNNDVSIVNNISNSNNGRCDSKSTTSELLEENFSVKYNENDGENRDDNIIPSIYRYKFTQDFMDELYKFSKVHQYDDRKSFKEAWKEWTENAEEMVETETTRLEELGYEGDVMDKMFKSARYYFRKKSDTKREPKERRKYVGVQKDLLDVMDSHILKGLTNNDYKPSEGFDDFCSNNIEALKSEIARLVENNIESNEIKNKIKKTYKNRYFMLITK